MDIGIIICLILSVILLLLIILYLHEYRKITQPRKLVEEKIVETLYLVNEETCKQIEPKVGISPHLTLHASKRSEIRILHITPIDILLLVNGVRSLRDAIENACKLIQYKQGIYKENNVNIIIRIDRRASGDVMGTDINTYTKILNYLKRGDIHGAIKYLCEDENFNRVNVWQVLTDITAYLVRGKRFPELKGLWGIEHLPAAQIYVLLTLREEDSSIRADINRLLEKLIREKDEVKKLIEKMEYDVKVTRIKAAEEVKEKPKPPGPPLKQYILTRQKPYEAPALEKEEDRID